MPDYYCMVFYYHNPEIQLFSLEVFLTAGISTSNVIIERKKKSNATIKAICMLDDRSGENNPAIHKPKKAKLNINSSILFMSKKKNV